MTWNEERNVIVSEQSNGMRLDSFLAEAIGELNRTHASAFIKQGLVTSNSDLLSKPSSKVKTGQRIKLIYPEPIEPELKGEALPLAVVFEDQDILVVNKERQLATHPAPGQHQGSLVNALLHHCGAALKEVGEAARPGIVHRLDKDTSGLIVIAKSQTAYQDLVKQFAARQVHKTYLAFVWGEPNQVGHWENLVARSQYDRLKMAVTQQTGKLAVTNYERIQVWRQAISLLKLTPLTGRTHQLRLHCCHHGWPIVGDSSYGKPRRSLGRHLPAAVQLFLANIKWQLLHAAEINFRHPITSELLTFTTQLPQDMQQLLDLLNSTTGVSNSP